MPERITSKNLKAEILEAYNELEVEYKLLKNQVDELKEDKARLAERNRELEEQALPTDGAAPASIDAIVDTLSTLRTHFSGAVNTLSAELTDEAHTLSALREEVQAFTDELREVHDLRVDGGTLDRLIQEYEATATAQTAELAARRRSFEQDMTERERAWAREQEEHERTVQERDRARKLARERDEEQYEYQLQRTRKQEAEAHAQEMKQLHRALDERVREKEAAWAERERAIAEREQHLDDLAARVEAFPEEIDRAVEQAREEAAAQVQRAARREMDLQRKEVDGEMQVYEQRVQALEATLDQQQHHLQRLDERLAETVQQAQDLAARAIESSSQASTYAALKEIALEQVKGKAPASDG